jgi:Domain of unknown function (DUF4157)
MEHAFDMPTKARLSEKRSSIRWPSERPPNRLLRFLWTAPTTMLGHALGLALARRVPVPVRGVAAAGWFYPFAPNVRTGAMTAITIGHAILYQPDKIDGLEGRLILAHELAHTRQHDALGPFYLPVHLVAEAISILVTRAFGASAGVRAVHGHNAMEQTFICLPASACRAVASGAESCPAGNEAYLSRLGMDDATYRRLARARG